MGRLTKEFTSCEYCEDADCTGYKNSCMHRKVYEKLAHYEDLEEQGRLICLPCKVGDTVWFYQKAFDEICEARIIKFELNCFTDPQLWIEVEYVSRLVGEQTYKGRADLMLGKTIFPTKEEAEAKLKELKEGAE